VLEALGVNIALSPDKVKECVLQTGIGFMFAPNHHKAMKHVMGVRRTLGFRTMFNILGPLSNPASARAQVLGVFNKQLVEPLAHVLKNIGVEKALVVHGGDGMDEISISGKTYVSELKDGEVSSYEITPEEFGLKCSDISEIVGGTAEENADIIKNLFSGKDSSAKLDVLLINSAAALYVGKKADSLKDGMEKAKMIIESGAALLKLGQLAEFTGAV
jgi:anthranilate phosphoribosyltransferase